MPGLIRHAPCILTQIMRLLRVHIVHFNQKVRLSYVTQCTFQPKKWDYQKFMKSFLSTLKFSFMKILCALVVISSEMKTRFIIIDENEFLEYLAFHKRHDAKYALLNSSVWKKSGTFFSVAEIFQDVLTSSKTWNGLSRHKKWQYGRKEEHIKRISW